MYSCSSRADHTILFHLEYVLSAAVVSDLVRCCSAVMMRGSVQGFGFGFPDIEEQSMLAAKTGAKAKDRVNGFRKGCSAPTAADSIHDTGMV